MDRRGQERAASGPARAEFERTATLSRNKRECDLSAERARAAAAADA
jgi:hypothetical protein